MKCPTLVVTQEADVLQFMRAHTMEFPAAVNRLLISGMPATLEFGNSG
jgi:hypothetical protein